jgi:glycosyltransferase involved in cell wall biosynthesis
MKIAQVAPLSESVPPKLYGGTERVVAILTEELVRRQHDVTLFASGDSRTSARLVPVCDAALRLNGRAGDALAVHVLMFEHVFARAHEFDVLHFHVSHLHLPMCRRLGIPNVTTMHGRLDFPELPPLYAEFDDVPVVSISNAQRSPVPQANWIGTVYHGLPTHQFRFCPAPGGYFAFLGRISPEKRVDRAIAIAKACGVRLRIAAKVDPVDLAYFKRDIEPLLDHPLIEFIGEIGDQQKNDFLGSARALLFPIDWPEPFGLVMIESLACGTPVVAFRGGSVAEIIEDGVTGYIVDSLEAAVERARRVDSIDRAKCREAFEQRFTASRMASDYLSLYEKAGAASERKVRLASRVAVAVGATVGAVAASVKSGVSV